MKVEKKTPESAMHLAKQTYPNHTIWLNDHKTIHMITFALVAPSIFPMHLNPSIRMTIPKDELTDTNRFYQT